MDLKPLPEQAEKNLQSLAVALLEIVKDQNQALMEGMIENLEVLATRRERAFVAFSSKFEQLNSEGFYASETLKKKLKEISEKILELDKKNLPFLEKFLQEVSMDIQRSQKNHLSINYLKNEHPLSSSIDIIK